MFDVDNIKLPRIEILEKYSISNMKSGVTYTVSTIDSVSFWDKQKLFEIGWKNVGKNWIYGSYLAYMLEDKNG